MDAAGRDLDALEAQPRSVTLTMRGFCYLWLVLPAATGCYPGYDDADALTVSGAKSVGVSSTDAGLCL